MATQSESDRHLEIYRARYLATSDLPDCITAFSTYLISTGAISSWQCAKLRNGQWKGFIVDDYELVDHLGNDATYSYFLASEVINKR